MSYSWLPPTLGEIAEVAGLDAALAIADARGGSRVSFPAHASDKHWLTQLVGRKAADLICAHYRTGYGGKGGVVLDLPLSPDMNMVKRRKKIDQMIENGVSADKIAVATRTHRTTVFRRKARLKSPAKKSPREPDLFD